MLRNLLSLLLIIMVPLLAGAQGLSTRLILERCKPGVLLISDRQASGSGFLISEEGHVVTNRHVACQMTGSIWARFPNNSYQYECRILHCDPEYDIAIIQLVGFQYNERVHRALPLQESRAPQGTQAAALGNPLGEEFVITLGIVSSSYSNNFQGMLATSAPLNPGNSGGPLLNPNGQVIGVNTKGFTHAQNANYAVRSDILATILQRQKVPFKTGRLIEDYEMLGSVEMGEEERTAVREGRAQKIRAQSYADSVALVERQRAEVRAREHQLERDRFELEKAQAKFAEEQRLAAEQRAAQTKRRREDSIAQAKYLKEKKRLERASKPWHFLVRTGAAPTYTLPLPWPTETIWSHPIAWVVRLDLGYRLSLVQQGTVVGLYSRFGQLPKKLLPTISEKQGWYNTTLNANTPLFFEAEAVVSAFQIIRMSSGLGLQQLFTEKAPKGEWIPYSISTAGLCIPIKWLNIDASASILYGGKAYPKFMLRFELALMAQLTFGRW